MSYDECRTLGCGWDGSHDPRCTKPREQTKRFASELARLRAENEELRRERDEARAKAANFEYGLKDALSRVAELEAADEQWARHAMALLDDGLVCEGDYVDDEGNDLNCHDVHLPGVHKTMCRVCAASAYIGLRARQNGEALDAD